MSKTYKLTIDLAPVAQARPRAAKTRGRSKQARIIVYDPPEVKAYKRYLNVVAKRMWDERHLVPLEGPIKLSIRFYRAAQKGLSKKERELRLSGVHRPTVKPDLDNYVKSTLDGLNGVIWTDDAHIVDMYSGKFYGEHPHLEIEIETEDER